MGVRILSDTSGSVNLACLYCSTSDTAFGPVFYGLDASDQALHFADWLIRDARTYTPAELVDLHSKWVVNHLDDEHGELTAAAHRHAVSLL